MNSWEIARLLVRIAKGDDGALAHLYQKTAKGVYAFLYSYLRNKEDTEDALQTVYLKVKRGASSFSEGTNGKAWLLQIAKNHALNELKRKDKVLPLDSVAEPSTEGGFGVVGDAMQRVLNHEEQRIIILHVLWGYRHREIAKITDCPVGTITSKYKRAIDKLRQALKEE